MTAQQYIEQLKAYMAKIQSTDTKVRPNQNADRRIGTVDAAFSSERFTGGTVPVLFDGEDTIRNIQTGTKVYANDRVGITRYGNTWAITDNFTSASEIRIMKVNTTTRISTTTFANDPDLYVDLLPGKHFVEFHVIFSSATAADVKTAWNVPADALGTRQVNGPGSATADAGDNATARWGGHAYDTSVSYGARNASSYFFVREWAAINVPTGGRVTFQWAQQVSTASDTAVRYGSAVIVNRIN
jgi:hypothetical protein